MWGLSERLGERWYLKIKQNTIPNLQIWNIHWHNLPKDLTFIWKGSGIESSAATPPAHSKALSWGSVVGLMHTWNHSQSGLKSPQKNPRMCHSGPEVPQGWLQGARPETTAAQHPSPGGSRASRLYHLHLYRKVINFPETSSTVFQGKATERSNYFNLWVSKPK